MRTSHAFVLRLLTDTDEPAELRGLIRAVTSGEEQHFTDGPALLTLLGQMVKGAAEIRPCDFETGEGKGEEER